eukprot:jgi/Tetstr1/438595/TSEL_027146.t1
MRGGARATSVPNRPRTTPIRSHSPASVRHGMLSRREATACGSLLVLVVAMGLTLGSSANEKQDKTSWPECVGMDGNACKALIEGERPELQVSVGRDDMMYTFDYVDTRVRVMVSPETGLVSRPPIIG